MLVLLLYALVGIRGGAYALLGQKYRNACQAHYACYRILRITMQLVQSLHDVLDTVYPPVRPCRETQEDVQYY